jgi:hypothetical protein
VGNTAAEAAFAFAVDRVPLAAEGRVPLAEDMACLDKVPAEVHHILRVEKVGTEDEDELLEHEHCLD